MLVVLVVVFPARHPTVDVSQPLVRSQPMSDPNWANVTGAGAGVLGLVVSVVVAWRQVVTERRVNRALAGAPWTLEHLQGDAWELTNVGEVDAHDVVIDPGDIDFIERRTYRHKLIRPRHSVKVMLVPAAATADYRVRVTWARKRWWWRRTRDSWDKPLPYRH